jgi:DNA-binding MarR family transcriptional regulator
MRVVDDRFRRIFLVIESGRQMSQRSIAAELGIALGQTNLLVNQMVRKGWLRQRRAGGNRVRYFITPKGVRHQTDAEKAHLRERIESFAEAREQVRRVFSRWSSSWSPGVDGKPPSKRIAFYGTGTLAEIGYLALSATDLELVAVVDDRAEAAFFGLPVVPSTHLRDGANDGWFDRLVITALTDPRAVRSSLDTIGYPLDRVLWL